MEGGKEGGRERVGTSPIDQHYLTVALLTSHASCNTEERVLMFPFMYFCI